MVCDATLAAGPPGVYAAGDLCRWPNELFGEEMRVEHWTNAAEQGAHAARNLLAAMAGDAGQPYAPVPFFWSDQYGQRIQFLGRAGPDDEVRVVSGSVEERAFVALYGDGARLRGVLGPLPPEAGHGVPEAPGRPDHVGRRPGARCRRRLIGRVVANLRCGRLNVML